MERQRRQAAFCDDRAGLVRRRLAEHHIRAQRDRNDQQKEHVHVGRPPVRHTTGSAGENPSSTSAKDQAQQAAGTAADESKHVAGVAKDEAQRVASEAQTQVTHLLNQATTQVEEQSRTEA